MVGWFDPGELISTGFRAVVSALVGEQSDKRVVQALGTQHVDVHDYSQPPSDMPTTDSADGLWIDYLADTGDGFNPTYTGAWLLAQPSLSLRDPNGGEHRLPRANLVILGGDQVYPAPSREAYQQRLVAPFELASEYLHTERPAHIFAVPGNHDWYDGLSAFMRLFCTDLGGRQFGAWRTQQTRSYFCLKLPGGWWLLGADSQLQADLDVPQIEFFETLARERMQAGDRVILCLSTPVWVHAHKYRQMGEELDETDLVYLRDRVFGPRGIQLNVFLSGDLHHYRRHEELDPEEPQAPVQKITAGGGGAFLHPTHDEDVSLLEEHFDDGEAPIRLRHFGLRSVYPSMRTSWWLSFGNLAFGWINPKFGIVPALLYFMTAWMVGSAVGYQRASNPLQALSLTAAAFVNEPGLTLWVFAVVSVFVAFNKTRSRLHKWLGGIAHAAAHWICIFYIGWGARLIAEWLVPGSGPLAFLLAGPMIFAGGWVAGSMIMGLYLLISLNVFGRHSEEAFSALRIQDYKNFLRLHVANDGTLTIYPIGIDRVPRRWRERRSDDAPGPSGLEPAEPLKPTLIEPPIVIRPATV